MFKKANKVVSGNKIMVDGVAREVTMLHTLPGGDVRITFADFGNIVVNFNRAFKLA